MPLPGIELLAAAAVGYLLRKARRMGGRADAEVDRVLDEGMDALHGLVTKVVGDERGDPAIERLQDQARTGAETERGTRRAVDAIADAIEENEEFASALAELVDRLERHEAAAQGPSVQASQGGAAAGRDLSQHAETGGVIISGDVHGGVNTGGPTRPAPDPSEG